ncbi:hypothetical protein SNE40_022380 [Patella caerulea]|uniref:Gag protein n=1 Tax=Patella caerulea TaxID=87958 RepID=A0AAN8IXJ8_PATCE
MSSIDKFNYLHSLLERTASRSIHGLTLSDSNYKAAVDILHERFGNTHQIISAHMYELLKIPNCSDDSAQLRFMYDKISVIIRGLESLGVKAQQYGSFLIPVIMSKLPSDICLQKDVWDIQKLLDVIKGELQPREISDTVKVNEQGRNRHPSYSSHQKSTASSLLVGDRNQNKPWIPHCAFCNEEHFSSSCEKIKDINKHRDIYYETK